MLMFFSYNPFRGFREVKTKTLKKCSFSITDPRPQDTSEIQLQEKEKWFENCILVISGHKPEISYGPPFGQETTRQKSAAGYQPRENARFDC